MEQSEELREENPENDETESNSSMSIIMVDELEEESNESKQSPPDYNTCVVNEDLVVEIEKDSEDSFSEMTRSQYAQV